MIRLTSIYILSLISFFYLYIFFKFGKIDLYLFKINFKIFFLTINQENISQFEKVIIKNFFQNILLIPTLILLILVILKKKAKNVYLLLSKLLLIVSIFFISSITLFLVTESNSPQVYKKSLNSKTDLFKKSFNEGKNINFEPNKNLILIVLESFDEKFINKLNKKYKFSNLNDLNNFKKYKLNNFYGLPGTNFTVGSLIATLCGVPFKLPNFPFDRFWKVKDYIFYSKILNEHKCIQDLLNEKNYNTEFIVNYEINFQGLNNFLKNHSFDKIYSNEELKKLYKPNPKGFFDAIPDADLFDFALKRIEKNKNKKFFIVINNIDTHKPRNLYSREKCKDLLNLNEIDIAYLCTLKKLNQFVTKIDNMKLQNTSIILVSDHLSSYEIKKEKLFNLILSQKEIKINDSILGHYDLFPLFMSLLNEKEYKKYYLGNLSKKDKSYEEIIKDYYIIINQKSKTYDLLW